MAGFGPLVGCRPRGHHSAHRAFSKMSPMADYSALMQHDTQTLLARLLGMAATEEPFAPGPAPFQVPEHRRAGSPVTPGLPWAPALSYHGQMQAARPGGLEAQCVAAGRRFPHVPAHLAWSTAAFPPDLPLTPVSEGSSASFLELAGALQMSMARPVSAEPGRSPTIPLASPPPDDPPSPGAADTKVPPVQGKIVFDEQRRLEYFDCYIVALDQHLRLLTDKGLEPERFGADIEDNYAFYKNTAQSKRPEYEVGVACLRPKT